MSKGPEKNQNYANNYSLCAAGLVP